jgi:peptidyl-tRNA hydrolase
MYAVIRADLQLPPGLAAAQAGHAFLASFLTASHEETTAYLGPDGFTKVALVVADEAALRRAHEHAKALRLPCALWVEDEGLPGICDGPVPVSLGIGPVSLGIGPTSRAAAKPVTKEMRKM